jgi:mannose-1-phosphate guanylyltransferase
VVKSFVEKPDAATAARYVHDGYLWNSGNFLSPDVLLAEIGGWSRRWRKRQSRGHKP